MKKKVGEFKSSHFDEKNILVHIRHNTRTDAKGNKVLFLEEIQSDWGQKGKKEGFRGIAPKQKMSLANIKSDTDIKFKYIDTIVKEWQDPSNKDSIMILQNELDGVTQIMKKNLQDLLKREENLDALMAKSNDLSKISVDFYKKAKSSNKKCCSMG